MHSDATVRADEALVRSLLRVAGLEPSAAELDRLVAVYADHRRAVDRLYDVPMSKEERPQPVFGFDGGPAGDRA
jgi:hypothetical protein